MKPSVGVKMLRDFFQGVKFFVFVFFLPFVFTTGRSNRKEESARKIFKNQISDLNHLHAIAPQTS